MQRKRVTATLAEFAATRRYEDLSADTITIAKLCLIDCLGVAFAGLDEQPVKILLDVLEQQGASGQAGIIGTARRTLPFEAALVNGTMAHALDFDDVHPAMFGHPSAPIIPALLAACTNVQRSGKEFITAFTTGVDVACLLGRYVGHSHYRSGFHATATLGAIGAAAACANLSNCSGEQTAHALSLAATQASGLNIMFGSMAKPLHAGKAAHVGLLSAELAARGFVGHPEAIEGPQGFASTHAGELSVERFRDAFRELPFVPSISFKYYASCFLAHPMIAAVERLRVRHAFAASAVSCASVAVDEGHASVCGIDRPDCGNAVKFSLRFLCAMALAGQDLGNPSTYSNATASDPFLLALSKKIDIRFAPGKGMEASVTIELTNGEMVSCSSAIPGIRDPIATRRSKIEAKFLRLVGNRIGFQTASRMLERMFELDGIPSVSMERLGLEGTMIGPLGIEMCKDHAAR